MSRMVDTRSKQEILFVSFVYHLYSSWFTGQRIAEDSQYFGVYHFASQCNSQHFTLCFLDKQYFGHSYQSDFSHDLRCDLRLLRVKLLFELFFFVSLRVCVNWAGSFFIHFFFTGKSSHVAQFELQQERTILHVHKNVHNQTWLTFCSIAKSQGKKGEKIPKFSILQLPLASRCYHLNISNHW